MLYSSGIRVSELVNLKREDINFEEKIGKVKKGKGSKDRIFTISENLCKDLNYYLQKRKDNKYIFSKDKPLTTRNIQKIVKHLQSKAKINKKTIKKIDLRFDKVVVVYGK